MRINLVLVFELLADIAMKVGGREERRELFRVLESYLMSFRNHALEWPGQQCGFFLTHYQCSSYQECIKSLRNLILRARYSNNIARLFCVWKVDLAIPFLFQLFDFRHPSNELTVVKPIDDNSFCHKFGILVTIR